MTISADDLSAASSALGNPSASLSSTPAQSVADAANSMQSTIDTAQGSMPLNSRPGTPPAAPPPSPPKRTLLSDILHAVGDVLGGPKTTQQVNPQTGQIEPVPLSREGRIANTIGIYARGAAAGAAQQGPGAVGKAALAGVQAQQQFQQQQQENLQGNAKLTTDQLRDMASRSMLAQDIAKSTWEMQREKTPVDAETIARFDAVGKLLASDDRNIDLGVYPTAADFFRVHPELDAARMQAHGKLVPITEFDDTGRPTGVRIWQPSENWRTDRNSEPLTIRKQTGVDADGNPKFESVNVLPGQTTHKDYLGYQLTMGRRGLLDAQTKHLADQDKWTPYTEAMGPNGEPLMRDEHGNIRIAGGGQSVNSGMIQPKPQAVTSAAADDEYREILKKQKLGQPLTPEDKATKFAYEQQKTLGPRTTFNLQSGAGAANVPLTPQQQATAQAIMEGRMTAPSGFALKTPYWQAVMGGVFQQDPQWSEQRAQLRKDYTTGKHSSEINSINTAMGHIGLLGDSIDALQNGDIVGLNRIANSLGVAIGQDPVTTWQTIVHRVGPEIAKAYLGAGGSAGERGADEADFDAALGPKQLKMNTAITARLLRSKIAGLENQWDQNKSQGMPSFEDRFIMPEAKRQLDKWAPLGTGSSGAPAGAKGTIRGSDGKMYWTSNGQTGDLGVAQ